MLTRPDPTGARWRKSTFSDQQNCVEVADNLPGAVLVRDTKDRDGATLAFARSVWGQFIESVRSDSDFSQ